MKRLLLFPQFVIFCCLILSAQSVPLHDLEGLIDHRNNQYFEWAGYDISIIKVKKKISEKEISKIKKKYKISSNAKEYSLRDINVANHVIESVTPFEKGGVNYSDIDITRIFYIIEKAYDQFDLICFSKLGFRDKYVEKTFIELYLQNKLSDYIISRDIDFINFVGRDIQLGNLCQWRFPHNINCKGGQVSWSVFDTPDKAEDHTEIYIFKNEDVNSVIIDDTFIPVIFEGQPITARRIVYKMLDRNYPLIVYYLCSEIDGKYVSCIMSHYGYNKNDYELPDLLKEFLVIESLPDEAWNKYERPQIDVLDTDGENKLKEAQKENKFKHYFLNVKTGTYLPLGSRKNILGTSPYISVGLYINGFSEYNYESNSAVFIDMGFTIPNNRKYFTYSDKDVVFDAKAQMLANISLGYIRKKKIKRNVFWENYGKLGVGILSTNIKKPKKNDNDYYYSSEVFSFSMGSNIRYKRVGFFIEYQFAPFNMSKHLNTGGNSALITGMNIVF